MANFFEKLGSITKSSVEKTKDLIEISKLNGKINSEKNKIIELQKSVGEFYWEEYKKGTPIAQGAMEFMDQIQACYDEIEQLQQQIEEIKKNPEASAEPEAPQNTPEPAVIVEEPENVITSQTPKFCGECGAKLESGVKFCGSCGSKII